LHGETRQMEYAEYQFNGYYHYKGKLFHRSYTIVRKQNTIMTVVKIISVRRKLVVVTIIPARLSKRERYWRGPNDFQLYYTSPAGRNATTFNTQIIPTNNDSNNLQLLLLSSPSCYIGTHNDTGKYCSSNRQ